MAGGLVGRQNVSVLIVGHGWRGHQGTWGSLRFRGFIPFGLAIFGVSVLWVFWRQGHADVDWIALLMLCRLIPRQRAMRETPYRAPLS